MTNATLERDGTTVTIPLVEEQSRSLLVRTTVGKPNLEIDKTGALDPRHRDNWSGFKQYHLVGRFHGSSAYSDAIDLIEMIKSHSGHNETLLNIGMDEFDSDIRVAPAAAQDEALKTVYEPGRRDYIEIDLGLTRINETRGDPSDITLRNNETETTPTDTGDGPIQLSDGNQTVDLVDGVTVSRGVGRPNSVVRRSQATYPNHTDKRKAAYDVFSTVFTSVQGDAIGRIQRLTRIVQQKLQSDTLELRFNGLYGGLGTFSVIPHGNEALSLSRESGVEGTSRIPTLKLRRVFS